ncbi:hypothetical protein Tco_0316068 [Tanacetum coccineum]
MKSRRPPTTASNRSPRYTRCTRRCELAFLALSAQRYLGAFLISTLDSPTPHCIITMRLDPYPPLQPDYCMTLKVPHIHRMVEYSQKWHNVTSRTRSTETSDGLAAIQVQLNNLGREIKKVNEKVYAAQVGCNNVKVPITPKIFHSRKKEKPLKKLTTHNLVHLFKEGDIKQMLRDFIKGTTRILRTKNEGNLWKIP